MDGEINRSSEPNGGKKSDAKILWLLCAFIPSVVGITLMGSRNQPGSVGIFMLLLNAACSLAAGIGILSGMKDKVTQVILGVFLGFVFFVLNVIIVVFVGCSGMGQIAP